MRRTGEWPRRTIAAVSLASFCGVLAACGPSSESAPNPEETPKTKEYVMRSITYARFIGKAACQKPTVFCNAPIYTRPERPAAVAAGGNAHASQVLNRLVPERGTASAIWPHEAYDGDGLHLPASRVKIVCQVRGGQTTGKDGTSYNWNVVAVPERHISTHALSQIENGEAPYGSIISHGHVTAYAYMAAPWTAKAGHDDPNGFIPQLSACDETENPQGYPSAKQSD